MRTCHKSGSAASRSYRSNQHRKRSVPSSANSKCQASEREERDLVPSPWDSVESAQLQLQTFSESFGLCYFRLCIQARRPSNDYVRVEFSNLSRMWVDRYRRCNYAKIDPVLALLDDANEPFAWDAIDRQNIEVRRYLEDAAFHGLVDGFTVPLHCSNGESAHLTLAGAALTTDIEERWAMYAATYRFQWTAFSSLRPLLLRLPGPPSTTLTDKQRQILVLLMQGMGVKSIARTLGLHARTVDDGLRRACLRLGVTSREQAIVRALATRQIDPAELVPPPPPPIEFHLNATRR